MFPALVFVAVGSAELVVEVLIDSRVPVEVVKGVKSDLEDDELSLVKGIPSESRLKVECEVVTAVLGVLERWVVAGSSVTGMMATLSSVTGTILTLSPASACVERRMRMVSVGIVLRVDIMCYRVV